MCLVYQLPGLYLVSGLPALWSILCVLSTSSLTCTLCLVNQLPGLYLVSGLPDPLSVPCVLSTSSLVSTMCLVYQLPGIYHMSGLPVPLCTMCLVYQLHGLYLVSGLPAPWSVPGTSSTSSQDCTFIMSLVFMVLCPKTIAFGAVATGSAKAYEQTIPAILDIL